MSRIRISQNPQDVVIFYHWFRPMHLFLLFFFIAWDAFLVFWYSMSFSEGFWIANIFPIAHVAVGIGGTYYVLAGLLNKTKLTMTKKEFKVRSYPLPWIGSHKTINPREVTQFYVKQRVSRGNDGSSYSYQLRYLDRNSNDKNLLPMGTQMDEHDVGKMEQIFENFLGIKDFSVPGEYEGKSFQTITSKEEFKVPIHRPVSGDPLNRKLFDLEIGGFVDYNLESYQITKGWQYDVDAGTSYKLFFGKSINEEHYFFFELGSGKLIMVEKEVPSMLVNSREPLVSLPKELSFQNEVFLKSNKVLSHKFDKSSNAPMFDAELVFYSNENLDKMLRLELKNGQIQAIFLGDIEMETAFSTVLPPSN